MNKYEKIFKEVTGHDFPTYYNEHKPSLTWYIAKSYTKDIEKAEDFANQAFMQSLEKIETYNKEKSLFKTWLTKIAINLVIKEWKDNHKYNFISIERDTEEGPNILNLLKSDDGTSYNEYENETKKKCEIIYEVIEKLPEKYKKVMVMRELNHMAYKEIADSIKKETVINISNNKLYLDNPEDFYSLIVRNTGDRKLVLNFVSSNGKDTFFKVVNPHEELNITRDEILWERLIDDKFYIDGSSTNATAIYVTTTNLSTIKSQIKKGREIIQKKVKKKFEHINKNGVLKFE